MAEDVASPVALLAASDMREDFASDGLRVVNTFIEVDEPAPPPPPGQLQRAQTAPPRARWTHVTTIAIRGEEELSTTGVDEARLAELRRQRDAGELTEEKKAELEKLEADAESAASEASGAEESEAPVPPQPAALCRLTTRNQYEPQDYWDWDTMGDPDASPPDGIGVPPMAPMQQMPPQMMPQQMVPMAPGPQMVPLMMCPMPVYAAPFVQQEPFSPPEAQLAATSSSDPTAAPGPPDPGFVVADGLLLGDSLDAGAGLPAGPPPLPQTLQRMESGTTGCTRVCWTVDARKLRGGDKQAVSPSFDLSCRHGSIQRVPFKMMIYPKVVNEQKGGASFKKSKGKGIVTLKCEADLTEAPAPVSFKFYIGKDDSKQEARGPVRHDFSASAVCGLPKDQEEWDFSASVDDKAATFLVCLEAVPDGMFS